MNKPVKIKLYLEWRIYPRDYLPDDFSGTTEDAVEWIKTDIAENIEKWTLRDDIYSSLQEVK